MHARTELGVQTNELIERQYLDKMGTYLKLFLKLKLFLHNIKSCEIMQNCPLTKII